MQHVSYWQLVVLSASLLIGIGSAAQRGQAQNSGIAVHPSPPDLARAFETIDIVLARIAEPLNSVSSALSHFDASKNRRELDESLQSLTHRWAAIMTVSNGKELPAASDLFFVYTEMLDLESYIDSVTNGERIYEQPRDIVVAATASVRAKTELLPVVETLRYAAADRIDAEEARCRPHAAK
jgi:hypothetical protein